MMTKKHARKKRIGEMLIEAGLIRQEQLETALKEQRERGGKLVEILIAKGFIDVNTFLSFLAKQPRMVAIELQNYMVSPNLIQLIPKELARKHEVFPIDRLGNTLTVAMACPLDEKAVGELEEITGLRVNAFLCRADDIHSTIDRYYPQSTEPEAEVLEPKSQQLLGLVESGLKMESIAALKRTIDSLPCLPPTVDKIQRAVADPEVSMQEVAQTINLDPVLAAKVLRVVNSAAFGFPGRVNTVLLAVTLLGLREIYMIVVVSAVHDLFERSLHFDYKRFWKRSLQCAVACKSTAEASGERRSARYYTAGLLLDIGQVALAEAVPTLYGKINQDVPYPELLAAEEETLGLSHAEAGYLLAKHWNLPPELAVPIRFHHSPELATEVRETVEIIALGAAIADCIGVGAKTVRATLNQHAERIDRLGLEERDFEEIMRKAQTISDELI